MPCRMSHASIDAKTRAERGVPEDLIRLCVGIEDGEDLLDDLRSSLVQSGAMNVTLDGIYAKNATVGAKHPPEGEHLAAEAAAENEP